MKVYLCTPGGFGTSIGTALEGNVRLEVNPPVAETFNTIPPSDYIETPPPMITKGGYFNPFPPTRARTLDSRTAFYYAYTLDSPGESRVGSQYLMGFLDADMHPLDGGKTYK